MHPSQAQYNASHILEVLRREKFYLFIGAAFTTVGLVSTLVAFLSRKFSPILLWFSLFSLLYGLRLWLELDVVGMMIPTFSAIHSLGNASVYLIPIPAFFYFEAVGFLPRHGKITCYGITVLYLGLFVAALFWGPLAIFKNINSSVIVASATFWSVMSLRKRAPDRDFLILRSGLIVLVVFVLCGNVSYLFGRYLHVEPIGFAIFLGTLGYIAVRRTLYRDWALNELQNELDVARRIQTGILPNVYRDSGAFRVATRYVPMTSIAGDFYDFFGGDGDCTGLLIADVSGHGVPAALIASMVKLAAFSQRLRIAHPADFLTGMNEVLCGNTQSQFVTAAYAYLDATAGILRYSAAAHPPMLMLRDGMITEILENGLMLGVFPAASFSAIEYRLQPGDRLVLYTDGIVEAANEQKAEFGQVRLQALVREGASRSAQENADAIIDSVQQWSHTQEDDLTVVVCDFVAMNMR